MALLFLWHGLASTSFASKDAFKVIVHPDNPVQAVERDFLRAVFLKQETRWRQQGLAVRPIDLQSAQPVREQFTRDVLRKTTAQLRNYWVQRIFSGTNAPPPEVPSAAAAIAYVLANPGAVAYLPADADAGRAKVVQLK